MSGESGCVDIRDFLVFRMRIAIAGLLFVGLFAGPSSATQNQDVSGQEGKQKATTLELKTTGQVVTSTGRRGIFRVYTSPDGTTGVVEYARFGSSSEAKRQIKDWRKLAQETKSEKLEKDDLGKVIGNRITATRKDPETGRQEFLIIKRNGLICYLIKSVSPKVAEQVEGMIDVD